MADSKIEARVPGQPAVSLVLGVGCQRGTPHAAFERAIASLFETHGLAIERVRALATLDRKRDEHGLLTLAEQRGWPIAFYSAEQLAAAGASVSSDERVRDSVQRPRVAEPAALLRARAARALVPTTVYRDAQAGYSLTLSVARLERGEG